MSRARHAPESTKTIHVVDVVPGPARKAWQISLIEEGGQALIELRLAARAPDGSLSPTTHRSLLRPETLRRVINALLAAEIDLDAAGPLLRIVGEAA